MASQLLSLSAPSSPSGELAGGAPLGVLWASLPCVDTVGKTATPLEGVMTGRMAVIVENVAPMSIGIPLVRTGRRWRMAWPNVGENHPPKMPLCPTPFASRQAALKRARRWWPRARVELTTYGLSVYMAVPDIHTSTAVAMRSGRERAKRARLWDTYSRRPSFFAADFAEIEKRVACSLAALRNSGLKINL